MSVITSPNAHGDGISCFGPFSRYPPGQNILRGENIVIEDTIVDFESLDVDRHDGGIDCVCGASVIIRRCIIRNVGKAMLAGNEFGPATVLMEDSIIEGCGRRCPEAQYFGVSVTMRRCLIKNWGHGRSFSVRAFGAYAHHGGSIRAESCVFWQDGFFTGRFWTDIIAHIGQAWNDGSRRVRDYLLPGVCRGLTAGVGGSVEAVGCYKNRWWIVIDNHDGPRMSKRDAMMMLESASGNEE